MKANQKNKIDGHHLQISMNIRLNTKGRKNNAFQVLQKTHEGQEETNNSL